MRRLVPRIWQQLGIRLSVSTLRRGLRQAGYGWKRTRRSLKHQRDPAAFAACQQHLSALHRAEARGELAVYYADEVRFSRQAPVPYAWQLRGQPAVCLPAERGAGGGYSVLGFWRPADPAQTGRQAFVSVLSPGAFTAELFVLAVGELLTHAHPAHGARARQRLDSQGHVGQAAPGRLGRAGPDPLIPAALLPRTQPS